MDLPPFSVLVDRYGDGLLRYARRLTGRRAEDVLQEAFLRALRSYERLEDDKHLRAWLYRIVTTTAYDASRGGGEVPVEAVPEVPVDGTMPDDGFEALIGSLSDGRRQALRLRYVHDLDYPQLARRLGCSETAARQRVSSGVRELRRLMT